MERTTRKTNKNSSIPSSQTEEDDTALSSGSKGKGKSVSGSLNNSCVTETVVQVEIDTCTECGDALDQVPPDGYERRTKIDITDMAKGIFATTKHENRSATQDR